MSCLQEAFDKKMLTGPRLYYPVVVMTGEKWNYWLIVLGIVLTILFGLIQSVTGILQVTGVGG